MIQTVIERLIGERCEPCNAVPLLVFLQGPQVHYVECPVCKRRTPQQAIASDAVTAWHYDVTQPFGSPVQQQAAFA